MRKHLRRGAALLAAAATALVSFAAAPANAAAVRGTPAPAAVTPAPYLSLGDSLAFGYRPDLVQAGDFNPTHYEGYAEILAGAVGSLDLTNYGCPGETTTTMISGGCPWLLAGQPLHDAYGAGQSQLQAAVAFLHQHPDTKLISVDIGSNDLISYEAACGLGISCIVGKVGSPTTPGTLLGNLTLILVALRQAAPQAAIVVFNYYNPQALDMPVTDTLLAPINASLTQLATALHDPVADAFGVINIAPGTPAERFGVCFFTWECTSYHNIHPTQAGYAVMAFALAKALRPPLGAARAS